MTQNYTAAEAIDAARQHQLAASTMEQSPQDPDWALRDQIELMRQWAPAAPAADSLYALGFHPQPVDPLSLAATGKPLTSVEQILAHWRVRPADGVAIPAGVQPGGSTLVALRGSPHALQEWLGEAATEPVVYDNEGVRVERRTWRPCPPYSEIRWSPPARAPLTASVFFGRDEGHEIADRVMKPRAESTGAPTFLVWQSGLIWQAGPPASAQRLAFKSAKIAPGVHVICDGAIPFHVVRADRWQLTATRTPIEVDLPAWLLSELGGRLVPVSS